MKLASITKIDFKFSSLMHSALVSIAGDAENMFVHVQLINSFLKKVFGVEHIRFHTNSGEIQIEEAKHPFVYQVAKLITSKVKELNTANENPLRVV